MMERNPEKKHLRDDDCHHQQLTPNKKKNKKKFIQFTRECLNVLTNNLNFIIKIEQPRFCRIDDNNDGEQEYQF